MIKYDEALKMIQKGYGNKYFEIINEAIHKAEKYDELLNKAKEIMQDNNYELECVDLENLFYNSMQSVDLRKENQELREQKEHYKAMVEKAVKENPLREPYDELLKENKILKEGIKAIKKAFEFRKPEDFINDNYYVLYQTAEIDSLCEDYNKIKEMLEVVENE